MRYLYPYDEMVVQEADQELQDAAKLQIISVQWKGLSQQHNAWTPIAKAL